MNTLALGYTAVAAPIPMFRVMSFTSPHYQYCDSYNISTITLDHSITVFLFDNQAH